MENASVKFLQPKLTLAGRNVKKRLRDLEEQVGTASAIVEPPASRVCTAFSESRNSPPSSHNDTLSVPHNSLHRKGKTSHQKVLQRERSYHSETPHGADTQTTQSLFNPVDALETPYTPSEILLSLETMSLPDPSTFWNSSTPLPTPSEGIVYPDCTEWPSTHKLYQCNNLGQYRLLCDVSKRLTQDTVPNAFGLSDRDKVLDCDLHDHHLDINRNCVSGQTTLHLGAKKGNHLVVAMLLEKDENIDDTDTIGQSALHMAAMNGHQAVVQLLIEKGAEVNLQDAHGRTPLYLAVENGHVQTVQSLLQQRPLKEIKDASGKTPLHLAVECGREEIVRLLLDSGADPRARVSP